MRNILAVMALVFFAACAADVPSAAGGRMTLDDLGVVSQATTLASPPTIFNVGITAPAGWVAFGPYSWTRVGTGSTTPGTTTSYFTDGFTGIEFPTIISNLTYDKCRNVTGPNANKVMTCSRPAHPLLVVTCPKPYVSNVNLTDDGAIGFDFDNGTGGALNDWFGPGLYQPNGSVASTSFNNHHAVYAQPAADGKWQVVCEFENDALPLLKAL